MTTLEKRFIQDTIKRLSVYKDLGDKTFAQLSEEDMNDSVNEESNSIAVIVQHLHGNMMNRFTSFSYRRRGKLWRKRDAEFTDVHLPKEKIIALWSEGWQCVMQSLQTLLPDDLMKTVYIRTGPLPVYDAILRQLAHYAYHVGQNVLIGK